METLPNLGLNLINVCDLMITGCNQWDIELFNELFVPRDVTEIIKIPISSSSLDDCRVWYFAKNGFFR